MADAQDHAHHVCLTPHDQSFKIHNLWIAMSSEKEIIIKEFSDIRHDRLTTPDSQS